MDAASKKAGKVFFIKVEQQVESLLYSILKAKKPIPYPLTTDLLSIKVAK